MDELVKVLLVPYHKLCRVFVGKALKALNISAKALLLRKILRFFEPWKGKELALCVDACKTAGKKCTRMETDDPEVRKYHCSALSTTTTTTTTMKPTTAKASFILDGLKLA